MSILWNNIGKTVMIFTLLTFMTAMSVGAKGKNDMVKMQIDTLGMFLDTAYTDRPYRTFYINYKNAGKKELVIDSVKTSCHCTTVEIEKKTLCGGECGRLKVSVDMSMFALGIYAGDIFIYSNAPDSPVEFNFWGWLKEENN